MKSIRTRILHYLKDGRRRTNVELAKVLGEASASVSSTTCRLWKQGLLKRDGLNPYVYSHQHTWRLGRLHEFLPGQMGCACGARQLFDLFEAFKERS